MEKNIKLGGHDLKLHSSLFTIIEYRNVFGTELFNDIKNLDKKKENHDEELSLIIGTIFKIIYILHRPYTKKTFDEFLMSLDFNVLTNPNEIESLTQSVTEMLGALNESKQSPQFK